MTLLVGTDIGGTFTDVVGYDTERRQILFGKTLTNYRDLVDGVFDGLAQVEIDPRAIAILKHGTTQIINVLLERKGARTALITTEGFRDVLEIGRASRPLPFDLTYRRDPALVERRLRFEVAERINSNGQILVPLDVDAIARLCAVLEREQIEAVAISFLNSYVNPVHEREAVAYIRKEFPGIYVTSGTEHSREWFEYERTSTAVANAYVGPRAARYIDRFEERLRDEKSGTQFLVMASHGGILSLRRAREQPVALVESGPIGGCIGAGVYARALGVDRMVGFDMGGTTAKCALIEHGRFDIQSTYYVGGYERGFPLRTPVLDIVEVGTGGGSIAYRDAQGRLHVGPRSAGSDPGPVCFGRGGREPTVTDANVALGRIGEGRFLSGTLQLDGAAAESVLMANIGEPMGFGADEIDKVAGGLLTLANAQMGAAIKEVTVERGKDIRAYALFAFGGGGPLHACDVARELNIAHVIVPPEPGNFSALGMLFAPARIDEGRTVRIDLRDDMARLNELLADMEATANAALRRDFGSDAVAFERYAEMRYKGQRHTIRVPLDAAVDADALGKRFIESYRIRYGRADPDAPAELVGLRVTASAGVEGPDLRALHRAGASENVSAQSVRDVYFAAVGHRLRTQVFNRYDLPIGFSVEGPAVIEEFGATCVIGPGDNLRVGDLGELRIEVAPQGGAAMTKHVDIGRAVLDPITAEVIMHGLSAIPNLVDKNIARTAYSFLISEYKDYAVGILDCDGKLITQSRGGLPIFVANALSAAVADGLEIYGRARLQHGDVVISNHAGSMGQHLNNVVMYTPIRVGEDDAGLVGFFAVVMHWMDVGGITIGSCQSPFTTDIFQEGIQFRTVKLLNRGERVEEMFRMIAENTRFPKLVLGDIESQIAGCVAGRDMVAELVQIWGTENIRAAVDQFWSRAEAATRAVIASIPDGDYHARSFLDDDGIERGKPVEIVVKVVIRGDAATIDLSGVAAQLKGPLNSGYQGGAVAASRMAAKYIFSPDGPANFGAFKPIEVVCPPGRFLSAGPTAPIGGSGFTIPTVVDTILRALAACLPERIPAAHHGTYSVHVIDGHTEDGELFQHIESAAGGWGAGCDRDGGGPFRSMAHGDTLEVPVELQEVSHPYLIEYVRLRSDSGGAGRHRGGLGLEKAYCMKVPGRLITSIERTACPPWGLDGGQSGEVGRVEVRRIDGSQETLLKGETRLGAGDRVLLFTAGGGGFGDPSARDPQAVGHDVLQGYVSADNARKLYRLGS